MIALILALFTAQPFGPFYGVTQAQAEAIDSAVARNRAADPVSLTVGFRRSEYEYKLTCRECWKRELGCGKENRADSTWICIQDHP